MPRALADPAQVTPAWLADVLRRSGALPRGQVERVTHSPAPATTTAMWVLWPLTIRYSPDASPAAPPHLLLKLARIDRHQPAFHVLGRSQEVYFYTHIAPARAMTAVPFVRCYDAVHDPQAFEDPEVSDAHVLVDDLSRTHWQPEWPLPPPEPLCDQAVACVAGLHAAWWQHQGIAAGGELDARLAWRLRTARALGLRGLAGPGETPIPPFLDFLGDRLSAARRRVYERLLQVRPSLRAHQARAPQTVLHGDAHWWNFLYPRDPSRDTTRILDWGSWRTGVATNDLAYMLALQWYPERRRRLERPLLTRYHQRLLAGGVTAYGWEELWTDYRWSVIWGLTKVAQCWAEGWPTPIWWGHLERALLAYDDLGCSDLLGA
ncbi:MAG TPA: aminoglycoside phosphotransferase [Chloroflexota bacterium]|jgi:hypothetical protein|nr:aminoglycoside phosphotransferase [Chloroflexota bacterium]